jgi:hypothetical protein
VDVLMSNPLGDIVWQHPFTAWVLDDEELAAELARAGLELTGTLDEDGRWVSTRLYSTA